MAQLRGRPRGFTPDGSKIRRLRVTRGITGKQLAAQIGRHPGTIRLTETYSRPISEVFAYQLANALGVPVEEILADSDEDEQVLAS